MGLDTFAFEDDGAMEGQKLDLGRYVQALKRRWWLALIIAAAVAIPWTIYVKQEKPVYEATATISFRNISAIKNPETMMQRIVEELNSRTFAEQVVAALGLAVTLEQESEHEKFLIRNRIFAQLSSTYNPRAGKYVLRVPGDGQFMLAMIDEDADVEIPLRTGDVFRAASDTISVNGISFQLADPQKLPQKVTFVVAPFKKVVSSLQQRVQPGLNQSLTLMSVKLTDNDPYVVTQTVNSLAKLYVDKSRVVGAGEDTKQLETLQEQVRQAQRDYDEIDQRYTEAKRRAGGNVGGNRYEVTVAKLSEAEKKLEVLKQQRDGLKELLDRAANTQVSSVSGVEREAISYVYKGIANHSLFDNNASMVVARQRLSDLESRRADELRSKTERHPDVIALENEITQLYAQIQSSGRTKLSNLAQEISRQGREVALLEGQLGSLPNVESTLLGLERQWKQKSDYLQSLQEQLQKGKIAVTSDKSDIEILDPAIEPEYPVNRNKKAKAATGGVAGLLLGMFVVVALEALDRSIKSVDDIKGNLKLNVLGTIPQINFGEYYEFQDQEKAKLIDQQLVTHDYAPTPVGEAYRSLRTNILYSKSAGRIQTFVITSTAPGDGKSFTAANLSITMAQQKSNTLLIDTDLRRGVLHNTFAVPKEPGFSNYLTGSVLASEIIHETHIPNLSVISCGSLIPNPSEMLGSVQLRRFLDEMRRRYDLIIFDTPPLNAATDAVVLGTQVDGAVIVVRSGKTNREVARKKIEMFQNVQAKILGVILNGTTVDLAHEGYSYYQY
ncbi:polysaccharide biosynthesis tyrosine autokinase [bacterium]|nr:polysaccharide biosynthesis tyrosine autokinase [bacterium]NUM73344.1 polysaccharide biosynthesis tyrosine autokinase [candidate division KSB1 bacterium]RIK81961.1 MAG: hypothetical protein DCC62_01170 [candidate division KSB1 bacterium]